MRKLLVVPMVMLVFFSGLAMACGGDDEDDGSTTTPASTSTPATAADTPASATNTPASPAPTTAATTPAATGTAAGGVQEITIRAGERGQEYFYSMNEIRVRPGEVRITMTNDGPERPHTLNVRNPGGGDLASSDRVDPGSSATITFTVTQTGNYQFLCTLPGHADRGQRGTLVVAN